MSINNETRDFLRDAAYAGDYSGYYGALDSMGHSYGALAIGAASNTGFLGIYANNFMNIKAAEYAVSFDRDEIMKELMIKDYELREESGFTPIKTDAIRDYHHEVFINNGLPENAWTGTLLDKRAGALAWCFKCSTEALGSTKTEAFFNGVGQVIEHVTQDFDGTAADARDFLRDMLKHGVLSETLADVVYQETGSLVTAGIVKGLFQSFVTAADMSIDGWGLITDSLLGLVQSVPDGINDLINSLRNLFNEAQAHASPIILDLDGSGINTVGLDQGVQFDHNGNGFAELTGWVGANDGLLVWDRNANGVVDNGTELFGDSTILVGGQTAVNGFAALAEHDGNGDGVIDASDAIWSELRVWRDLSQDGITREGELVTLDALGISSINLAYTNSNHVDEHGNAHRQVGSFTWADGSDGIATDVWFAVDRARTQALDLVDVSAEIAALPELQGLGYVHSLHQAMARDESGQLQALVAQYLGESDSLVREALMIEIIYHWAGVTDVELGSRGSWIDARSLAALEVFLGESFMQGSSPNPGTQAAHLLSQAFNQLLTETQGRLLLQTHFKPYLHSIEVVFGEAGISYDFTAMNQMLDEHFKSQGGGAFIDLIHLHGVADNILVEMGWSAEAQLGSWALDAAFVDHIQKPLKTVLGEETDRTLAGYINELGLAVVAGAGNQTLSGHDGANVMIGHDEGVNTLLGGAGDDLLVAGVNDRLFGGDGNDTLIAAEGALLNGQAGDNLLVAAHNTVLRGGTGNDTYRIGADAKAVTVHHNNPHGQGMIEFGAGVVHADARLERHGNHLHMHLGEHHLELQNWFLGARFQVNAFQFADGTRVAAAAWVSGQTLYSDALAGNQTLNGHDGANVMIGHDEGVNTLLGGAGDDLLVAGINDRLFGGDGNDTLIAAEGALLNGQTGDNLLVAAHNTVLRGGTGNDTYRIGADAKAVTVHHNNPHGQGMIEFGAGVVHADARLERHGNHLHMQLGEHHLELQNWFLGERFQVNAFQFADGTRVAAAAWVGGQTLYSNALAGNQTLSGHDGANVMIGHDEGVNTLLGGAGDDLLVAGVNDRLFGGDGNDTLIAAEGSHLYGGAGADQYHLQGDYNGTRIYTINGTSGLEDSAHFLDTAPEDLWMQRQGNDLVVDTLGEGNRVTFAGWYSANTNRIGDFHAGGMVANAVQVERLVTAMAAFSPPADGFAGGIADETRQELAPAISVNWTAAA